MIVSSEARLAWALPHKVRVGQSMLQTTERLRKSLDEAYDDQSDSCCWQSLVEGEEGNGWICMYNRAVLRFESESDEQHQSNNAGRHKGAHSTRNSRETRSHALLELTPLNLLLQA